jgi:hypothetical protein
LIKTGKTWDKTGKAYFGSAAGRPDLRRQFCHWRWKRGGLARRDRRTGFPEPHGIERQHLSRLCGILSSDQLKALAVLNGGVTAIEKEDPRLHGPVAIDLLGRIWTLPASGGTARPITDDLFDARQPAWSPDGKRVAFLSYREGTWGYLEHRCRWIRRKEPHARAFPRPRTAFLAGWHAPGFFFGPSATMTLGS